MGRWWRGSDEEEDEGFDPMNRAARYGTARQRGRVESVTARSARGRSPVPRGVVGSNTGPVGSGKTMNSLQHPTTMPAHGLFTVSHGLFTVYGSF